MFIILWFVEILLSEIKVLEYFIEFLKVDEIIGKGFFYVIVDEIKIIGFDINNIRG